MSAVGEGARVGAPVFTVATWNVCLGVEFEPLLSAGERHSLVDATRMLLEGVNETRFPDRAETIARVIARHRPDVLGLQELGRWETGDGDDETLLYSFPDILLEALAAAGAPYVMIRCVDTVTGQLPVDGPQWVRFTSCDALLLRMDPDVDMSVIEIDDGHYASYLTAELAGGGRSFPIRRGWVSVDLERNGRRTRVVVTHLDSIDPDVRRAQAHELVSTASTSPYPVVLVGNLNSAAVDAVHGPGRAPSSCDRVLEVLGSAGYVDAWSVCDDRAHVPLAAEVAGTAGSVVADTIEVMELRGATWGPAQGLRAPASPSRWETERVSATEPERGAATRDLTQRIDYVFFDPTVVEALSAQVIGVDAGDVTTTRPHLLPSDHGCLLAQLAFRSG